MDNTPTTPMFADRYRFEPVGNDWDRGRSGYTHLVYDLHKKRLGVIKRAEITSKEATEGLKNEVNALRTLKGLGVPEVYETGQAIYGSKNYNYMVIEYIDGLRIEKKLDSLSLVERIEIIAKFFELLSQTHQKGIVNGDVDLKHLFWRREKKQLVVIDWGNAKLGVDPKKKTEFTYDLARSAEIIFSLITRNGRPPATGSIVLPNNSALASDLGPVPNEFRSLCEWARTPTNGVKIPPFTAVQLFEISQKWLVAFTTGQSSASQKRKRPSLAIVFGFVVACFAFLAVVSLLLFKPSLFLPASPSITVPVLTALPPTDSPTEAGSTEVQPISTSTVVVVTETPTPTSIVMPSPAVYSPILTFDNKLPSDQYKSCLESKTTLISPEENAKIKSPEGLYRSYVTEKKEDWWIFIVDRERSAEEVVQTDFQSCVDVQVVDAMAVNALVTWLEPQREGSPEREFGFFLESKDKDDNGVNKRREYTLWADSAKKMYLRLRENNITTDISISVISLPNLQSDGVYPFVYYKFPIQIFLDLNNGGFDMLYLKEASYTAVGNFDVSQMKPIDDVTLPAFNNIQKIGLVGHGGLTKVGIWPLIFYNR